MTSPSPPPSPSPSPSPSPPPSLQLRKARFKDRIAMDSCNRRNLPENYPLSYWESHLQDHPYFSRVLVAPDNSIVGYALCDGEIILSLAIDKFYRHQKYGTVVLQDLQKQCDTLKLQVRVSNLTAMTLYKKMGFVIEKELINYYSNPTENGYSMVWSNKV